MGRPDLRILADDLTGALDSTAPFARPDCSLAVVWSELSGVVANSATTVDTATREGGEAEAATRHRELGTWLIGAGLAFKKLDSLLRGHVAAEIAALASAVPDCRFVIAPAFPHHDRFTQGGRQWLRGQAEPVGPDLAADLAARGVPIARGAAMHDATTDADLDTIVRQEMRRGGPVIWVGSAGLASALARQVKPASPAQFRLDGPMLALVGSDHPVTREQIAQCGIAHVTLCANGSGCDAVDASLRLGRSCVATVALEAERQAARRDIAATFARLLAGCRRPGLLFATGGETLRAVGCALGATALAVEGSLEPGLPVSRLVGGQWDGLRVVSKSGAFGRPGALAAIAARAV